MDEHSFKTEPLDNALASQVLSAMLESLGVTKYVLFAIGEPCEHGCDHAEMYSRGLQREELNKLLVYYTAALNKGALDGP